MQVEETRKLTKIYMSKYWHYTYVILLEKLCLKVVELRNTMNVERAKMMGFIKTCDQYRNKFNFDHFFSSVKILFPFSLFHWENVFSSNAAWRKWIFSLCLGGGHKNLEESFAWGIINSLFSLTNAFCSSLITIHLKMFPKHGRK